MNISPLLPIADAAAPAAVESVTVTETMPTDLCTLAKTGEGWCAAVADYVSAQSGNLIVMLIGFAITLLAVCLIDFLVIRQAIGRLVKKTETKLDDVILDTVRPPLTKMLIALGFYISATPLLVEASDAARYFWFKALMTVLALLFFWGLLRGVRIVDRILRRAMTKVSGRELDELCLTLITRALQITIIVFGAFFIGQSVLGWDISALIAGAGVIGLAIALASKETVSNIFGSLMIAIDKPFTVGERVRAAGMDGVVEHVGFRSTRILQSGGHSFTIPNSKIADIGIDNLSRLTFLKHAFDLTLNITSPEELELARKTVLEVLADQPFRDAAKPPRVHFNTFKDWTVNVQFVTIFQDPDMDEVQAYLEKTNVEIVRRLTAEKISVTIAAIPNYLPY